MHNMEASTAMVNGQGDGSAQIIAKCSSDNVATILKNISSIVDDTSNSQSSESDTVGTFNQHNDLSLKSAVPDGSPIQNEAFSKTDNATIKKSNENDLSLSAQADTCSSAVGDSQKMSTEPHRTSGHDNEELRDCTGILNESSISSSSVAISKALECSDISHIHEEETQKPNQEKPSIAVDATPTVSSSPLVGTNSEVLAKPSSIPSNPKSVSDLSAISCKSSYFQQEIITKSVNQNQTNCQEVQGESVGTLHKDKLDPSANVATQSGSMVNGMNSPNLEGENVDSNCFQVTPPTANHQQHSHFPVTSPSAIVLQQNSQENIPCSSLFVSKEQTPSRTNPSTREQERAENPFIKSDSGVVSFTSLNPSTFVEEIAQPVQVEEKTLMRTNSPSTEEQERAESPSNKSDGHRVNSPACPKPSNSFEDNTQVLENAVLNEDTPVHLEADTCNLSNIAILESASIMETDDLIEDKQKTSEVQQKKNLDESERSESGTGEANEVINESILEESHTSVPAPLPESKSEEISSSHLHNNLATENERGNKLNDMVVNEINENTSINLPQDSECLGMESDGKEHFVKSQESVNSVILIEEESEKKTDDVRKEMNFENTPEPTSKDKKTVPELKHRDTVHLGDGPKRVTESLDSCKTKLDNAKEEIPKSISAAESNSPQESKSLKTEEKPELQSKDNPDGVANVKKRNIATEDASDLKPKRQKLDDAEQKPVEEKAELDAMEVVDSDDDVIVADDPTSQKVILSQGKEKSVSDVKREDCKELETKPYDLKGDTGSTSSKTQDLSQINLSSQVLHAFITARIKAFIKKQKQQQIDKLNQRISMVQSSTVLWKETAKHLERSVKEVTVLNQGVEKRRAHVNACKKLSSRTVGTQVNDDKVKSAMSSVQLQSSPQISNRGAEVVSTNPSLGPSVLLNPSTLQQPQKSWAYNQNIGGRPPGPLNKVGTSASSPRPIRPPALPSMRLPPPPSDVVDLTDDDDVLKKNSQPHVPGVNTMLNSGPLSTRTNITTLAGTGKTSLNGNGFIPVTQNRTILASNVQFHPSVTGSQSHQLPTSAAVGPPQGMPNARLVQLPNHPLAPASNSGHPTNVGFSPHMATQVPVSNNQAQEPSNSSSAQSQWTTKHSLPPSLFIQQQRHPAPLPPPTDVILKGSVKALKLPPKPTLKISRVSQGIVLSWNMPSLFGVEVITSYQLFAYQETDSAPRTSLWKKVGDVRALPLPMACTLTQFLEGNKYHFAVRGVDKFNRTGTFSDPRSIFLGVGSTNTKTPV